MIYPTESFVLAGPGARDVREPSGGLVTVERVPHLRVVLVASALPPSVAPLPPVVRAEVVDSAQPAGRGRGPSRGVPQMHNDLHDLIK